MLCRNCGREIHDMSTLCPYCGTQVNGQNPNPNPYQQYGQQQNQQYNQQQYNQQFNQQQYNQYQQYNPYQQPYNPYQPMQKPDTTNAGFAILSFLIPLFGFIYGGICCSEGRKRSGKTYIITGVVSMGINLLSYLALLGAMV